MGGDLVRTLRHHYWRARTNLRRRLGFHRNFDEIWGVDTGGHIELSTIGSIDGAAASFGAHYLGSPVTFIRGILRSLNIRYEDYVFVDLGSGKGRALLLAAELPFREVVGVEISPELHAVALSNIARLPTNARRVVRAEVGNAARFAIPDSNAVIFLANPFWGPVLDAVIDNIVAALVSTRHDVLVLYLYPKHREAFDACRFLAVRNQGEHYVIYGRAPGVSARGPSEGDQRPATPPP
jgi:SAM-dependent methyltransferase